MTVQERSKLLQNHRLAEIQVAYSHFVKPEQRITITSAQTAVEVFRLVWDEKMIELIEHCKMLLLNRRNQILGVVHVSSGGRHGTIVDPKIIFGIALKSAACAIIIAHNHPSSGKYFSEQDKALTKRLHEAGKFLDVTFLDHIIITKDDYTSYNEEFGLESISHYKNT